MYIILLNKLRFDQNSCSRRSATRWPYGVLKRYELVKRLGTPVLQHSCNEMKMPLWPVLQQ